MMDQSMMDLEKSRMKRSSSIFKKLVHSLSFPKGKIPSKSSTISLSKSKSWHCTTTTTTTHQDDHVHDQDRHRPEKSPSLNNFINNKRLRRRKRSNKSSTTNHHHHRVTPNGCFCVYVGAERQRFIIKTKYANHPLFKMLLEDAETEYGYNSEGPLLLPCDVDLFYKVLAEMDHKGSEEIVIGCGSSCSPFSPVRRLAGNGNNSAMAANNNYSPYALLTPPRLIKINNHF